MMSISRARSTAVLSAIALTLAAAPALARGGGGRGGGGGHVSGGHFSGGGTHFGGGGGHASPGVGHSYAPSYRGSAGIGRGGVVRGGAVRGGGRYYAPGRGGVGAYGGVGVRGYGSGFVVGGRVPVYAGGHVGGFWYGPHYGWRVPAYWGGYYRPYPTYWGLGYWVTDWVMLDLLAAEEARMLAYDGAYGGTYIVDSPPLDTSVREELRQQVEIDLATPAPANGGASRAAGDTMVVDDPRVAAALGAPHHVFVVSREGTAIDRTHGGTCSLTRADLLRTTAPVPSGQAMADVVVAAGKRTSCPVGTVVSLPIIDLVGFERDLLDRVARGSAAARTADQEPAPQSAPQSGPQTSAPPERLMPERAPMEEELPSADDVPSEEEMAPASPDARGDTSL